MIHTGVGAAYCSIFKMLTLQIFKNQISLLIGKTCIMSCWCLSLNDKVDVDNWFIMSDLRNLRNHLRTSQDHLVFFCQKIATKIATMRLLQVLKLLPDCGFPSSMGFDGLGLILDSMC